MSDLVTLVPSEGTSVAEMMGIPQDSKPKSQSTLASLGVLNDAIMGTVEVNGKKVKTEIVPSTAFRLRISEEEKVYSDGVTIRTFAVRQRWTKWNGEEGNFIKSTMAPNLKVDLKDNKGGFNCNRPSGFFEDFHSLPPDMQQRIRTVKRTQVILGEVQMDNPVDAEGNTLSEYEGKWVPFVYEIKSNQSIKSLNKVYGSLINKHGETGTIKFTQKLAGKEEIAKSGKPYAVFEASSGDSFGMDTGDSVKLSDFNDWIIRANKYVEDEWDKNSVDSFSDDDSALVSAMVDVEESD
mgnify:FL=1